MGNRFFINKKLKRKIEKDLKKDVPLKKK